MTTQRTLNFRELESALFFVGTITWDILEKAKLYYGTIPVADKFEERHGVETDGEGTINIYVGEDLPGLLHELGHAAHVLKYPECLEWPAWKAEAYAMLSDMRAMKAKKYLTPEERKAFAYHVRESRKQGFPEHLKGLKVAFRAVFGHSRRKDQEKYIVETQD
ncbi:MAG TPA: hypothetical protein VIY48_04235 [Candidatus Paceibacterota bacterium]